MKFDKVIQYDGFIHDPCRAYLYIDQINYIVDASNNFEYGDGYLEVDDRWLDEKKAEIIKNRIGDSGIDWEKIYEYKDCGIIVVINNSEDLSIIVKTDIRNNLFNGCEEISVNEWIIKGIIE